MQHDIRDTAAARAVDTFYERLFRSGEAAVWTATDLDVAPDGQAIFFSGQSFNGTLEDGPSNAIYRLNQPDNTIEQIAHGRLYRNAPDGRAAYVEIGSNGEKLAVISGTGSLERIQVDGRIEALAWSPNGETLLLLVADPAADVSGVEGGYAMRAAGSAASWLPEVTTTDAANLWRRLYRWSDRTAALVAVTEPPVNVWEAVWSGDDALLVVASDHHSEGSWYTASVRILDAVTGEERSRHQPSDQVGMPASAPDGQRWAAIEAFCSDRGLVCGSLVVNDAGAVRTVDLDGLEVTDIHWRTASRILFAGLREAQTIVGEVDVVTGDCHHLWVSDQLTIGGWTPRALSVGEKSALSVIEGYASPPAIVRLSGGDPEILAEFAPSADFSVPGVMSHLRWTARDGLEIDGWLILPDGEPNQLPLFVDIHGGPVSAHRNRYLANLRAAPILVDRGFAVLLPNPRGSSGRGQRFARMVKEDMGGEDMHDYLAGIDHLVAAGIVDPERVAVSGTSYGGFMSAQLVVRTRRFAAAVPISPVSNWYSQHFASQIPWFDEAFLKGSPREAGGQYFDRSPVFFANGATTPTLVLAGGRDKNTPTNQAVEFFGALSEAGVDAALAVYPNDGHSLRGYPAYIDSAARIVDWLDRYIPGVRASVADRDTDASRASL